MIIQKLARMKQLVRGKLFPFLILCGIAGSASGQNQAGGLVIPVVFHIVSEDPDTVTDLQIVNALADLNNAFAHGGMYASGPGVNTGIQFCLAKTGPDGGNTSGITRTHSVLGDFDSDIENDRLKNLVSWDTRAHCNIWYVGAIKNEYLTQYGCGSWSRRHDRGYGTFDASGDYRDGVVTKMLGSTLASLVGEYLGLKYTFVQGSCANNNCDIDGDGVCDTPPAAVPGSSCSAYQNSCNTDSLSGFTQDVPDLVTNFMSLSGPCTNSFTAGQANKMRSNLTTVRNSLLNSGKCNSPCPENIAARFTRDNWFPQTGDLISFTSLSSGGTNYQWLVDGVPAGSNSPVYSSSFTSAGKYHVSLKVYNADPGCFASYSDDVLVSCGVMARFTPNVREIASKDLISLDSILFTNRSVGAMSYQWWMSNDQGMNAQTVSSSSDLNYVFKNPGAYAVWLVALNGSCTDSTEKFKFNVHDPTVDGTIGITQAACDHQTLISATLNICNAGYASIPAGTPVSFYDAEPNNAHANKLPTVYFTTAPIAGRCCASFTTIIDAGRPGLNQIYAVFNDNGNKVPVNLPNTQLPELSYSNNINRLEGFQFRAYAQPDSASLLPGDSVLLTATAGPGDVVSYTWASADDISCTNCDSTIFVAANSVYSVRKKVTAASANGCTDSAFVVLHIPPADDFRLSIDSLDCAGEDSLHLIFTLCNDFKRGTIPKGLRVSFYDGDPSSPGARLLGPVFSTPDAVVSSCASYGFVIFNSTTGKVFALVNETGPNTIDFPGVFFEEAQYDNNGDTATVKPFLVRIIPSDTTIDRSNPVLFSAEVVGGSAITYQWEPLQYLSCADCPGPIATTPVAVDYQLTVKNAFGCTASNHSYIKIFSGGRVNIPNGFSPNHDGHNDVFYILGSKDVKMLNDFSIYNRWGQKVFQVQHAEANDPRFGWQGVINGKPAEPGAYVYFVQVAFTDGTTELFKGSIILVR